MQAPPTQPFINFSKRKFFTENIKSKTYLKMAAISSSEQPQMQQIDLMKLNLQQLTQLKNQLDQVSEIFIFSNHLLEAEV